MGKRGLGGFGIVGWLFFDWCICNSSILLIWNMFEALARAGLEVAGKKIPHPRPSLQDRLSTKKRRGECALSLLVCIGGAVVDGRGPVVIGLGDKARGGLGKSINLPLWILLE